MLIETEIVKEILHIFRNVTYREYSSTVY